MFSYYYISSLCIEIDINETIYSFVTSTTTEHGIVS